MIAYLNQIFQIYSRNNSDKNELAQLLLEYNRLSLTAEAKDSYNREMDNFLKSNSIIESEDLCKAHQDIKGHIMEIVFFKIKPKLESKSKIFLL